MRHLSKLMMILSSGIISLTSCYESALDMPAENLRGDKVHAQMYVSLNYDDAIFSGKANASNRRFIVEARDAENTENVIERKEIIYNTTATAEEGFERIPVVFELDQKKYIVSVWMDYIEKGTDKDFYYHTEDLSKITMIETPASDAEVYRDALAATQTIDLTQQALGEEFAVNTQLTSRIAKWNITANDWRNFVVNHGEDAARHAVINVAYNSGVAKGFNLYTASAGHIQEGIAFESPISVPVSEQNTKITLAEDYFFLSQNEETISLTVNVKSATGELWYTQNDISLTCKAGEESISESNYLTGEEAIKDPAEFAGEGTPENPYLISSMEHLTTLMELINSGDNKDYPYQTSYYKQTIDLDASSMAESLNIGNAAFPFKGVYDGNGKKISNNTGLFGTIEDAIIKNIRLENSKLDSKSDIGGLICTTSKGASKIENCGCSFNDVEVQKTLGGICAEVVSGTLNIEGCKVSGNRLKILFKEGNSNNGGLIGKINSGSTAHIKDSYITLSANMTQAGANKSTPTAPKGDCIGGLCGMNDNGTLIIERCYVNLKLQGGKDAETFGGIVVGKGSAVINSCFSVNTDDKYYTGSNVQWTKNEATDSNVIPFTENSWPDWATDGSTAWGSMGDTDSTYPTLKWENND